MHYAVPHPNSTITESPTPAPRVTTLNPRAPMSMRASPIHPSTYKCPMAADWHRVTPVTLILQTYLPRPEQAISYPASPPIPYSPWPSSATMDAPSSLTARAAVSNRMTPLLSKAHAIPTPTSGYYRYAPIRGHYPAHAKRPHTTATRSTKPVANRTSSPTCMQRASAQAQPPGYEP
jgi:hypothetical protein